MRHAPGQPPSPTPLIDRSIVERLLGIAERSRDHSFVASVVDIFMEHTPGILAAISRSAAAADGDQLKRLAHRLKGSSLSVGGAQMGALCVALEALCAAETLDGETAVRLALELRTSYEATTRYLRSVATRGALPSE